MIDIVNVNSFTTPGNLFSSARMKIKNLYIEQNKFKTSTLLSISSINADLEDTYFDSNQFLGSYFLRFAPTLNTLIVSNATV